MIAMDKNLAITVQAMIHAPMDRVWDLYTAPEHIIRWNHASDNWHSPKAENDLQAGGKFSFRMEAKDGSAGFDFFGTYQEVETGELITYTMGDGRNARVTFSEHKEGTNVEIQFEAETTHSMEMQRDGWQAILDNFKKYTEG